MESGFEQQPLLENQFKTRYNRDVQVFRKIVLNDDKTVRESLQKIKYDDLEYNIYEYYTKDGKTDYVMSGTDEKMSKYADRGSTYLEAEVYVADLIGAKENGNNF